MSPGKTQKYCHKILLTFVLKTSISISKCYNCIFSFLCFLANVILFWLSFCYCKFCFKNSSFLLSLPWAMDIACFLALFKKLSYNPISFLVYFIWDTDQIYTSGDSSYQLAGQIEKILDRIKLFAITKMPILLAKRFQGICEGALVGDSDLLGVLEAPDGHILLSFLDPFSFCVP